MHTLWRMPGEKLPGRPARITKSSHYAPAGPERKPPPAQVVAWQLQKNRAGGCGLEGSWGAHLKGPVAQEKCFPGDPDIPAFEA